MEEEELDIKDMLTSFDAETTKYGNLVSKLNGLANKFAETNHLLEGLKAIKKKGYNEPYAPILKFLNPNLCRWEELTINKEYAMAFVDLAMRQTIYELQITKKEIDHLLETQK